MCTPLFGCGSWVLRFPRCEPGVHIPHIRPRSATCRLTPSASVRCPRQQRDACLNEIRTRFVERAPHVMLPMVSQELRQVSGMPERLEIGFVLAVWDCRLEQSEKALKAHVRGPTLIDKPLHQQLAFVPVPELDSERTPDRLAKPLVKAISRVRVELFKSITPLCLRTTVVDKPEKPPSTAVCLGQHIG